MPPTLYCILHMSVDCILYLPEFVLFICYVYYIFVYVLHTKTTYKINIRRHIMEVCIYIYTYHVYINSFHRNLYICIHTYSDRCILYVASYTLHSAYSSVYLRVV